MSNTKNCKFGEWFNEWPSLEFPSLLDTFCTTTEIANGVSLLFILAEKQVLK